MDHNHLLRTDPQENCYQVSFLKPWIYQHSRYLLNQTIKFISQGIYVSLPYDQLIYIPFTNYLSCLSLTLGLFSSVSWVLLILSLLARLCKTDCQFIMLEIASANWLDKTWVPLLFKWCFDAFRCRTVIAFPWFMKWRFFSQHLSFRYLFTSAAFIVLHMLLSQYFDS